MFEKQKFIEDASGVAGVQAARKLTKEIQMSYHAWLNMASNYRLHEVKLSLTKRYGPDYFKKIKVDTALRILTDEVARRSGFPPGENYEPIEDAVWANCVHALEVGHKICCTDPDEELSFQEMLLISDSARWYLGMMVQEISALLKEHKFKR